MASTQLPPLQVLIQRPGEIIWKGEAEWVSSKNSQGTFDILPFHSNFITIIKNHPIKIKTKNGIDEHVFSSAILYTYKNTVKIYTNI